MDTKKVVCVQVTFSMEEIKQALREKIHQEKKAGKNGSQAFEECSFSQILDAPVEFIYPESENDEEIRAKVFIERAVK